MVLKTIISAYINTQFVKRESTNLKLELQMWLYNLAVIMIELHIIHCYKSVIIYAINCNYGLRLNLKRLRFLNIEQSLTLRNGINANENDKMYHITGNL